MEIIQEILKYLIIFGYILFVVGFSIAAIIFANADRFGNKVNEDNNEDYY